MNFTREETARYHAKGWWQDETIGQVVRRRANSIPDGIAFAEGDLRLTWRQYDQLADRLAGVLATRFGAGDRVAVLLPDGAAVHIAFVAAERAGVVVMGIGWRAGESEIAHLVQLAGVSGLVTHADLVQESSSTLVARWRESGIELATHVTVPPLGKHAAPILVNGQPVVDDRPAPLSRQLGPDDLFLLNSTSGTTGRPKCVMHTQNRWFYFHQLAVEAGALRGDDVFLSAIPAPYGFGLWTAHFTPTLLGCPTHILPRFSAEAALSVVAHERVTVLCCVSTQFIMMLNADAALGTARPDVRSLRVMFTGGESVPYERARQFEQRTGAVVLQFFGSNETGALSRTTLSDSPERRLTTAGRLIPEMSVRLFGDDGTDVTGAGGPGQPGCRGPATGLGYWRDDSANAQLYTADGWMLTGDIVEVDDDGYLRVVGRQSDFIIRGGKNISAGAVEDHVAAHPAVALAAAVGAPDPVFGERVGVFVTLHPGGTLDLPELCSFLEAARVTREWWPEHLVIVNELPRSSGGKVAKGQLRDELRQRLAAGPP